MHWSLEGFDLNRFVRETLAEDLGEGGDITSAAVIPADARFAGVMDSRDAITVAGLPIAEAFFAFHIKYPAYIRSGASLNFLIGIEKFHIELLS